MWWWWWWWKFDDLIVYASPVLTFSEDSSASPNVGAIGWLGLWPPLRGLHRRKTTVSNTATTLESSHKLAVVKN